MKPGNDNQKSGGRCGKLVTLMEQEQSHAD